MKYRILTDDELEVFAEDLKHFLIVNGVHSEEWEEINKNDKEKAIQLVELFSDNVLQIVYEKMKFIEHRSPKSCMVFQFKEDEIELISLNVKNGMSDLSTPESIHDALVNRPNEIALFKTTKKYNKKREIEIHEMLTQGCVNSSEEFWVSLNKLI
ncbi:MAG: DUF6495 family protein [Crocinitomicaceae bacterium]|mgnify:FL=1|jgi:hypothetical protein|nr:DUF6495 family protein [Crocinitomicaceae bacterium]